jgi:hypothetical protein
MARTPGTMRVKVTDGPEWKRVEAALLAVDKDLAEKLRAEIRDAADTLVNRAQHAVERIPVHGSKHSGFRVRVAEGVGVRLTASGVQISASMNRKDERNLPAYLDAQAGWRHPVYGNEHNWVRQGTGGSWFRETIENGHDMIENRLTGVLEQAARDIAHDGL